jgi:superfamily II DNA or RNA helicase
MPQRLRPYQTRGVVDAVEFVAHAREGSTAPKLRCYTAPTGTGKGTLQLALLKALRAEGLDAWILTPSLEIVRGFLERLEVDTSGSSAKLAKTAFEYGIATGTRFINRVVKGEILVPDAIIIDEVHEFVEKNSIPETILNVVGDIPLIGYTATPYRATPRETKAFRDLWGEPIVLLTLKEAIKEDYLAFPQFSIWPLIDDDQVRVTRGEFSARSLASATLSRLADLAKLVANFLFWVSGTPEPGVKPDKLRVTDDPELDLDTLCSGLIDLYDATNKRFDKPTMVSVSSTSVAHDLADRLVRQWRVPAFAVTQKTKAPIRARIYQACQEGRAALIQISVLTRGADLPGMRRLIDAQPTMSPVRWIQTIGRVMRPGDVPSEVIVTNRNLERHSYLLSGFVPTGVVVESQQAFGGPSIRTGARELGLEPLSRFKSTRVPLEGGGHATSYMVYSSDTSGTITDYCVVIVPGKTTPLVARRLRVPTANALKPYDYESWRRCVLPSDFTGYASAQKRPLSDKQKVWWRRSARKYGLQEDAWTQITQHQFQVLPVLRDLQVKVAV